MKKLILAIFMLFTSATMTTGNSSVEIQQSEQTVWICTGRTAEVYHSRNNCRGLNNCKGQIKQITLEDAKEMGRRACKICY